MKIIFLDIDGVLNMQSGSYNSHGYDTIGNDPIEPHLMKRLEFIIARVPNVKLVISSSWHQNKLIRRLKQRRFEYLDLIIDRTPRDVRFRGNQIKAWLDDTEFNIESYVVLEDEIIDVCGSKCDVIPKGNVIEVDMDEGLSHKDCIRTIKNLTFPKIDILLNKMFVDNDNVELEYKVVDIKESSTPIITIEPDGLPDTKHHITIYDLLSNYTELDDYSGDTKEVKVLYNLLGTEVELTSESYDVFYLLGFRPHVSGNKEELIERWGYIQVNNDSMRMSLTKDKGEENE